MKTGMSVARPANEPNQSNEGGADLIALTVSTWVEFLLIPQFGRWNIYQVLEAKPLPELSKPC